MRSSSPPRPRLRVIARAGTGVDNVDVAAATDRGIVVMNAPGANSVSVAEHAWALMLALSRSIGAADAAMKKGVWDKKRLTGAEMRGKTLGVVGLGRIGQEVTTRARAFGMHVLAHDPFISEQVAATMGAELVPLDDLCGRSDYITLHIPATAETRNLFNAARLASCKPGVRIINTARGELIDEAGARRRDQARPCRRCRPRRVHGRAAARPDARAACRRSSRRRTSPPRRWRPRSWSASKP